MLRCIHSEAEFVKGKSLVLNAPESHHLVKVLRARVGETVELLDGRGGIARCVLQIDHPKKASLLVEDTSYLSAPVCRIEIAQAIPKGKKMDFIVQKATEIGATHIYPILSSRTEVRLDESKKKSKQAHWEGIAVESCKQCGNPFLPKIHPAQSFKSFIAQLSEANDPKALYVIASLEEKRLLIRETFEGQLPERVVCLIGPEGDFTPEEYGEASAFGFKPIKLSRHVLRSDTAAIYILSLIDYELQCIEARFS